MKYERILGTGNLGAQKFGELLVRIGSSDNICVHEKFEIHVIFMHVNISCPVFHPIPVQLVCVLKTFEDQ